MTEPDVALTDYAIVALCTAFSVGTGRQLPADSRLRGLWIAFFVSIGAGALFGGTVHGFFLDQAGLGYRILWPATLLALGVTASSMWFLGAALQLRGAAATWVQRFAVAQLIVYSGIVLFVTSEFYVAMLASFPATVFLLVALVLVLKRAPDRRLMLGVAGFLLMFVGAAVQQLRVSIHPVYFSHNVLFHLIQGAALFLIYVGARSRTAAPRSSR